MRRSDRNEGKSLNGFSAALVFVSMEMAVRNGKVLSVARSQRDDGVRGLVVRAPRFGLMANRCSAADAECFKQMRDNGKYKQLGMTWATFCLERAGAPVRSREM